MKIIEFINIHYLAKKLAENEIIGWHAACFLLAGNILYVIFSFVAYHLFKFGFSVNTSNVIVENVIIIFVMVFGLKSCYKIYSNNDFLLSFIVLSLPSLIYSTMLNWVINISLIQTVKLYGDTVEFNTSDEVVRSMERASKVLEIGPIVASVISIAFFYFLVRIGFKVIIKTK